MVAPTETARLAVLTGAPLAEGSQRLAVTDPRLYQDASLVLYSGNGITGLPESKEGLGDMTGIAGLRTRATAILGEMAYSAAR